MASSSHHHPHSDVFDPRIAYPAATDSALQGLRASFNEHIDWLEGYLQQVKEADVLRAKSANLPSSKSSAQSDSADGGLWVNILKSPARKRTKEGVYHDPLSSQSTNNYRPISSLSYTSAQSKQKSIFTNSDLAQQQQSIVPSTDKPKGSSSSNSLSRSPAKTGLKGLANTSTYSEENKENPLTSTSLSRSTSSRRALTGSQNNNNNDNNQSNILNRSSGTPKRNALSASTTTLKARSPGIRSPLQSSTSKARQQQASTSGSGTNLSASAPASPLRSPGIAPQSSRYQQSPLTRSHRLTQTTSSANASPSTTTSNAPLSASSVTSKVVRPVSPSPTPRAATRTLRSPETTLSQASPRETQQGRLLSPLSFGSSKVATPRATSGDQKHVNKANTSANATPVRVVDDVFTLSSAVPLNDVENHDEPQVGDAENNSKESEDMDDDEEEIENILLGYTKTPAVEPGKKVLKSDIVRSAANGTVAPVVEVSIKEKDLPAIPQASQPIKTASPSTKSSIKAAITRISPPRPTKSPARPISTAVSSNNNNKDTQGKGIIANISPSKITRPIQNFRNNHNYSPVKRDMSHLASIASMLSPSKPAQKEEQPQQNNGDRTEAQSRPASPQVRIQSKVPVPQTSATASPARPRSPVPGTAAGAKIGANPNSRPASPESRPTSPSRISSRIAALTGAARSNTVASASTATSRENSPKIGSQAASPSRFGITRSPRLKQALRMDSPASPSASHQQAPTSVATASGLPTPTKMKRPMLSPIQSPNSQRSLALSSLRKAVPGFETNSFSPPASPRLPSTTSISSNLHHIAPTHASTVNDAVKATQIQKQLEEVEKEVQMQLEKDEDLINQHARAISALGKSLPPPSSLPRSKQESADSGKKAKPAGLSPPAKSPLRKMNSKTALANTTSLAQEMRKGDEEVRAQTTLPTPSRDANETIVPQTVVKKTDTDAPVQNTAHKDSVVDVPPASPIFSSFLANNKRTSTLSFAGLPGRALGATGREKSIGLGLGLGKSLGASSMKDKIPAANQLEDADSQSSTQGHTRQSFYTAALASQSRKRLSSTLGSNVGLNGLGSYGDNGDPGGSKAPRSEFSNTARASILASQVQRDQPAPTMSHSARFDLLRSRISNIKGSTGYMPPSTSMRTSFATSSQAPFSVHHLQSSAPNGKPEAIAQVDTTQTTDNDKPQILFSPTVSQSIPTSTTVKDIAPLPTSTTSTFASTIASFVPAQSFGASFASIFGAGAMKATKPESPAKTKANELEANNGGTSKQVQSTLYPSLPSMNNLNMPLASFTSPEKMVRKPRLEPEDEELVEELASSADHQEAGVLPAPSSAVSSPAHEKKRSSSVLSIVSNIEAKEAEARREKERQASLSPRKASGSIPIPVIQNAPARASAPRSTTPTFSPPKQDTLARLSTGHSEARTSSRPESRLSDMPALPGPEGVSPDLSIAGLVDIEDPGLDAIPRTFSDDAEIPTTEAASVAEDEEMEEADDEGDEPEFGGARRKSGDISVKPAVLLQQSAPAPKIIKPAAPHAGNLSKSTFKPSRPAKEGFEPQRPVHRPPSRAPSVSSLAPSRASTVSLASTSTHNPSRPGTAMSMTSKKGNLSAVSTSAGARPEIKSLANAAAAAKKEQAEKERKAAIKEERDQKRAAFLAAKRDEQDSQGQQSSQGTSNGLEKKRKERDDLGASQIASSQSGATTKVKTVVKTTKTNVTHTKTDDEQIKKRKMDAVEVVVNKPAVTKTTVVRPPQQKAQTVTQSSNYAKQTIASSSASSNAKALAASSAAIGVIKQAQSTGPSRPSQQASTSKGPLQPNKSNNPQALLSQHQQAILSASAAFGKSQASSSKATAPQRPAEPEVPEPEPFQLPEIDSEYSDSDEDVQAQKAALRPVWTHSPELRQALAVQAMFDPDQLFGEMPALKMEEIFKNPATIARLRHRTSSAHWSGPDAISKYEEKEYAKRMGFKKIEENDGSNDGSAPGSSSTKR